MILMMLLGLGLPALIMYSVFQQGEPEKAFQPIPDFENLRSQILALGKSDYRVLSVADEDGWLRVNILLLEPSGERMETRIRTTNALYDVQSIAGRDLSVSVWSYRNRQLRKTDLEGLVFYSSVSEQLVFKTAEELP